jgi:hypothetical protein
VCSRKGLKRQRATAQDASKCVGVARKDNDAGRGGRAEAGGPAAWLAAQNPLWRQVGRVMFHLVENKRDAERPLAFLATYTHRLLE